MAEEVLKYLPNVPELNKKKNQAEQLKKPQIVDKEVLNLTGGLFPARLVDPNIQLISKQPAGPPARWIRVPIVQQNKKLGQITKYTREDEKNKLFIGEKFNIQPEVVIPSREEYHLLDHLKDWTYEQTAYMCQLLQQYNINFIVVQDRYDYNGKSRTVEEIKEHYYDISAKILHQRNIKDHPLLTYKYDRKYEENRKFEQQKYLLRNKQKNQQQKNLIEEIRRLDIIIKKEERQQINLKKALKLEEVVNEAENDFGEVLDVAKLSQTEHPVYTRQQYLSKPLQLPPKVNLKLQQVLQGLNIPEKIIANKANEELYDKLRRQILIMFSAQRYIKKKEAEKKFLEQKKKKITINQDQIDKKKLGGADQLKKKMNNTR